MTLIRGDAVIGISDHGGWAVLVTAQRDGTLVDRRRVELVDEDLPKIPHHHEAHMLPVEEGVRLVERVRASAERHAKLVFEAAASEMSTHIVGIALRQCPALPATIAECLADYYARNNADWVMYRKALAEAAGARGWLVHWYDTRKVFDELSKTLHRNPEDHFKNVRKAIGPPWNNDHKLAMAAAVVAAQEWPKTSAQGDREV